MSRKPPSEDLTHKLEQFNVRAEELSQQHMQGLELLRTGLALTTKLDEERQKVIQAILITLNGDGSDGLITTVSKLKDWMNEEKSKKKEDKAGGVTIKQALIGMLGAILCAIIGGLFAVWVAKIKGQ
jgi:hypothetical protein